MTFDPVHVVFGYARTVTQHTYQNLQIFPTILAQTRYLLVHPAGIAEVVNAPTAGWLKTWHPGALLGKEVL
jgi:hypothetical protein